MPILWRRLAWFASFGIALILIAWMRSQGFGWLPSLCAAAVVYVVSPFVISQFCAAFVLSRLHANSTRSPGRELQRILPAYVALQRGSKLGAETLRSEIDICVERCA